MTNNFETPTDYEAYCFLKKSLAPRYQVVAFPSTEYYSEWEFHYQVLDGDRTVATLHGNFRDIAPGSLASRARALVTQLTQGGTDADRQ